MFIISIIHERREEKVMEELEEKRFEIMNRRRSFR